jgi:glycosyltransferase involved in cell wall biosynthesis
MTGDDVLLTVVLPCLNEAETIADCVAEALQGIRAAGTRGEVIAADNGSTDESHDIAERSGARIVAVPRRGYGSAILGGIAGTNARWIVMADADGSYDLTQIPLFVKQLEQGAELVQGCRLPSGGGTIEPGAMPWLHRYVGNPVLSWLVRRWFRSPVRDVHCGMRAFSREAILKLDLRCTGMEFASEMVIKAALHQLPTAQVPITLRKDKRVTGTRHLRTFRDGWRHLRFMLLYSPRWLFTLPGFSLLGLGLLAYAFSLPRLTIGGIRFDVGTLLVASLGIIAGVQAVLLGSLAKTFALRAGLLPGAMARGDGRERTHRLELSLIAAAIVSLLGLVLIGAAVRMWVDADFGNLDYAVSMRWLVPGSMLVTLGLQLGLSNFLLSVIELPTR